LLAVSGTETASPVLVTTFQANQGEMIIRSRTVNLTIAATSSMGAIKFMQLGDSARRDFGPVQSYKKRSPTAFPKPPQADTSLPLFSRTVRAIGLSGQTSCWILFRIFQTSQRL